MINASGKALTDILAEHDRPGAEIVILECSCCGRREKKYAPHNAPDTEIMRGHFKGWTAKGTFGAKATRCPSCRS